MRRITFAGLLLVILFVLGACGRETAPPETATAAEGETMSQEPPAVPDAIPAPDDVASVPDNTDVTASGLASRVLVAGTGSEHPLATSNVEVHYSGWTTDGQMFDSSRVRGQTAVFPLNRVIAGWTEGVQLMVVGEKRRFWIPAELAYANSSRPGAPQGMLVFDIELIDIRD